MSKTKRTAPEDLLTLHEAAAILHVRPRSLEGYRRRGALPYIRVSANRTLYRRADVEAYLAAKFVPSREVAA